MCEKLSGHKMDIQVNPAFVRANEVKPSGDARLLRSLVGNWQTPELEDTPAGCWRRSEGHSLRRACAFPLTGIGRYTWELASALMQSPQLTDLRLFSGNDFYQDCHEQTM